LKRIEKCVQGQTRRQKLYFKHKLSVITKYIGRTSISFLNFTPDHIICFFPHDVNRHHILKLFFEKITKIYNNRVDIDFSDSFVKNDPKKSIKEGLTAEDYNLVLNDKMVFIKNLLIIDDVIDTGDTINIYLTKLFEKGFINNDTVIKVACIYNNTKIKKENVLEAWKKSNSK
jgi:hypoxanthine phosphoribosyltransferase